jgi:hypothetical protein
MLKHWFQRVLTHKRFPLYVSILAIVLVTPSIWSGLQVDDFFHRLILMDLQPYPDIAVDKWDLFHFTPGEPEHNQSMMEKGLLPWWSSPVFHAAFWRPVTVATHRLDYILWPNSPVLMHIQSILWYGALIFCAALLYRRMPGPANTAAFAALLYALDDAHGFPVGWIANRNGVIAALFGVTALIFHDAWRRHQIRFALPVACLSLSAGLLSAEAAVGITAYFIAYSVYLDEGSVSRRFASLLPYTLIIVIWLIARHHLGYGVDGSELYIDPLSDTLRFLNALWSRLPLLLASQLFLPMASAANFLPGNLIVATWIISLLILVTMAWFLKDIIRSDRIARFWTLGMCLSLIPVSATFPHERLLFFCGLGGMGLLAQFILHPGIESGTASKSRSHHRFVRILVGLLICVHLILSPIHLAVSSQSPKYLGLAFTQTADTIRIPEDADKRDLILVNPPIPFAAQYVPVLRILNGQSVPLHTRALAPGDGTLICRRLDDRTIVLKPENGFVSAPFDDLFRDIARPFKIGDTIVLDGVSVKILEVLPDGRPAEAAFIFNVTLEDSSLMWFHHDQDGYRAFRPPPIGERMILPAQPYFPGL